MEYGVQGWLLHLSLDISILFITTQFAYVEYFVNICISSFSLILYSTFGQFLEIVLAQHAQHFCRIQDTRIVVKLQPPHE